MEHVDEVNESRNGSEASTTSNPSFFLAPTLTFSEGINNFEHAMKEMHPPHYYDPIPCPIAKILFSLWLLGSILALA